MATKNNGETATRNDGVKATRNDGETAARNVGETETRNNVVTATRNDGEAIGYTFQWKIDNISHCWWFKEGQCLESPKFIADGLEATNWSLWLYPMGDEEGDGDKVGLYIYRENSCKGPDTIHVKYQLAFLDEDGSPLEERKGSDTFCKEGCFGYPEFEARESMFVTDRKAYLPEDTLTVQCILWTIGEDIPLKLKHLYGRTILNVSRKSFGWRIDKFSALQPGARKKLKNDFIEFDLVLNEESCKNLNIDMISRNNSIKFISCNTWIIDSEEKKENLGIKKYSVFAPRKGVQIPMLIFPSKLLENKNRYFPNDVLSLEFDIVLCTVEIFDSRKKSGKDAGQEKYENRAVLIDDLKTMYNDHILSDIVLRTSTKTFPAHMNILSARSSVFKKMFSHDMKEKNSGHVDIDDLEDDTLHQMLLYIYTGFLDDLQLESASKLYAAADKYDIRFIKARCTSFLKGSLSPITACDILNLADLHQDDDLKKAAQAYILNHDEIFPSQEWECFMKTNLKLAADTMLMKIISSKIRSLTV